MFPRRARFWISATAVLVVTFLSASDAWACSCGEVGPPCQNAFRVDAIFSGTVRSITELPDDRPPLRPGEARIPIAVRVDFDTVDGFRGINGPKASIVTAGSGPACGYTFKVGERYVVYASKSRDGGLSTSICSRTRPMADAAEDLSFLKSLSAPAKGARVFGTVQHWESDLASGTGLNHGPVKDVRIWVRNSEMTVDAFTDEQGQYEVTVPPGTYEITAMPPGEFSPRHLNRTAEMREAGACYAADFTVRFDGRIRGVVRQSGEPAAAISVELIAAQDIAITPRTRTRIVQTDVDGSFEFLDVSPGLYLVGVDLTRRIEEGVLFPATFHPGTSDAALATQVQIVGAQQQQLEPMVLPPARRRYRLSGSVLFADGTPAGGAFISLRDGNITYRQVARGTRTEPGGAFSFVVHEGNSYIVHTTYFDEIHRQQFEGSLGPFVISNDVRDLKVTLSPPTQRTP